MDWLEPAIAAPALRALIYFATIACAGAILFHLAFPDASRTVRPALRWQIGIGFALLLLAEPLRYLLFQLEIAGGDLDMALSPDLRSIYLETPQGSAALARLSGGVIALLFGLRVRLAAFLGAMLMITGYLLEGHSVSHEPRWLLAGLIGLHLLVLHWWIGSLPPLYALSRHAEPSVISAVTERFGRIATLLVPVMLLAGLATLGLLANWDIRPAEAYQQRMALKILLVLGVLAFAAINKIWLTPMLASSPQEGARYLRGSLALEFAIALSVIIATAWTISTAPGM